MAGSNGGVNAVSKSIASLSLGSSSRAQEEALTTVLKQLSWRDRCNSALACKVLTSYLAVCAVDLALLDPLQ